MNVWTIAHIAPAIKLNSRPRPPIRPCPVCGIAMLASKSRENLARFDKFECLTCQTVISETQTRSPGGDGK